MRYHLFHRLPHPNRGTITKMRHKLHATKQPTKLTKQTYLTQLPKCYIKEFGRFKFGSSHCSPPQVPYCRSTICSLCRTLRSSDCNIQLGHRYKWRSPCCLHALGHNCQYIQTRQIVYLNQYSQQAQLARTTFTNHLTQHTPRNSKLSFQNWSVVQQIFGYPSAIEPQKLRQVSDNILNCYNSQTFRLRFSTTTNVSLKMLLQDLTISK